MKVLRHIVGWVRSRAGVIWKAAAPHDGRGALRGVAADAVRSRKELVIENALLRHQIVILRRKSPRPRLTTVDRLWLLVAAAVLPTWRRALAIVQPETLLPWHREGFRMFWRRRSRPGRVERRVTAETISLIREMATKNRLWGAERIRGELLTLGIKLSKRTVQKYMRSVREHRGGGQGWATFCATFDRVAKGAGTRVLKTAVRAPNMNPVGERFVGSLRREALDHVLFLDDQHLENVARQYVCYFNTAGPHQGMGSGSRMAR
jgi:transposase InsO family protein